MCVCVCVCVCVYKCMYINIRFIKNVEQNQNILSLLENIKLRVNVTSQIFSVTIVR